MAKRRTSKKDRMRFSARNRKQQKRRQTLRKAGRWGAWFSLAILIAAIIGGTWYGLRRLLLTSNEHFTLRNITVTVYGDRSFSTENIRHQLAELGIIEQQTNLFEVNLAEVRKSLESRYVSVNRVSVRRHLPGDLEIIIRQRDAVAQLISSKSLLLDRSGLVIPKSDDPLTWTLPVITGLRNGSRLRAGTEIDDPLVLAALRFILLLRGSSYGEVLNVNLIQLDYSVQALKVYLQRNFPFQQGACVILPLDQSEMESALERLMVIVRERNAERTPIQFIDATYKINVPVRP